MPSDNVIREFMEIGVGLDDKQARKGILTMVKEFTKRFKQVDKGVEKINKTAKGMKKWTDDLRDVKKEQVALEEKVRDLDKAIGTANIQMTKASKEQQKQLRENIKLLESEKKAVKATLDEKKKLKDSMEEQAKGSSDKVGDTKKLAAMTAMNMSAIMVTAINEAAESAKRAKEDAIKSFVSYGWADSGKEIGEGFADSLSSISSKDLAGMGKGLAKSLGAGMKGMGAGMTRWAAKKGADPNAGAMGKAMGKLAGSTGQMVGFMAKMGPMLSATAGILVAIVKVILDAESAAKEFNKNILQSASTAETLAAAGYDSQDAFKRLDKTMDSIRKDATSLDNIEWGLKKEDHQAVLNTLTQEGVTIEGLSKSFENAGKSANNATAQVQSFGDAVHASVAYSRIFGVSLQEISQFQAEMMTELGSSLADTQLQFSRMTRAATESGIASNKFFAMIRGVSADLSMYNTRLEDAVGILKLLGKAMSAKEAGKFMSSLTGFFKQQSEEDRIKMMLIMGKDGKDLIQRDLGRKTKSLIGKISEHAGDKAGEVQKTAEKFFNSYGKEGGAAMEEMIKKAPKEMQGSLRQAMNQIAMDKKRLDKGGLVGAAEALQNVGAAGVLTAVKSSMGRFTGGKKLSDMIGLEAFAARKIAGINQEQFDQAVQLEKAVETQREEMGKILTQPRPTDPEEAKKWDDMRARLAALGITNQKQLAEAKDDEIIAAMSESDQEALANSQQEINYAKEQTKLTYSMTDKMETIIEGIFEFLYGALKDVISDLNEFMDLMAAWFNKDRNIAKKQADDLKKLTTDENAALIKKMESAAGKEAKLKELAPLLTKGTAEALEARKKELGDKYESASLQQKMGPKILDDIQTTFANLGKQGEFDADEMRKALKTSGLDDKKADAFVKSMEKGASVFKAMEDAQIAPEDAEKIIMGGLRATEDKYVTEAIPKMSTAAAVAKKDAEAELKAKQEPGKAPTREEAKAKAAQSKAKAAETAAATPEAIKGGGEQKSPSGQSAATAKSAAPGTGGAPTAAGPADLGPAKPADTAKLVSQTTAAMGAKGPEQQKMAAQQLGVTEAQADELAAVSETMDDVEDLMRKRGIVLNKTFMSEKLAPVLEDSMLKALRVALFEYWMYSDEDRDTVANELKTGGFTPGEFGQKKIEYATAVGKAGGFLTPVPDAQSGALIKGITPEGMAVVQSPPPGHGLMYGAPGELVGNPGKMAAAAGGGGAGGEIKVKLELSQDLQKVIRAEAGNVVYESKGRERFRD